uniref:Uncharacterized protein n=1 Tax=Peronospora matthiolae TaxID=2874970 RepID=A0AAV1T7U7_9STRA
MKSEDGVVKGPAQPLAVVVSGYSHKVLPILLSLSANAENPRVMRASLGNARRNPVRWIPTQPGTGNEGNNEVHAVKDLTSLVGRHPHARTYFRTN